MNYKAAMALAAILSALPIAEVSAAEVAQAQPNVMFCTETDSNGFVYNEQQRRYVASRFNELRHTINIVGAFESITLTTSGEFAPRPMQCRPSAFVVSHPQVRECTNGAGSIFIYNPQNNRFTLSTAFGHVYGDADGIAIAYGTCQRF